jgi:hypothetical protein
LRKITPQNIDRHKVYQVVYNEEKYADQKFKKLLNLGVQLLEDFIHFSMHKKDAFSKQKALISFTTQHKLLLYWKHCD